MMKMMLWGVCCIGGFLGSSHASDPEPEKVYFEPGPFEVGKLEYRTQMDLSRRDRTVPIKVHYPRSGVEEESFPLVVFSHGEGGTYDSHEIQAAHLASHGYVVFCLEHILSNNWRIIYYMKPSGGTKKIASSSNPSGGAKKPPSPTNPSGGGSMM